MCRNIGGAFEQITCRKKKVNVSKTRMPKQSHVNNSQVEKTHVGTITCRTIHMSNNLHVEKWPREMLLRKIATKIAAERHRGVPLGPYSRPGPPTLVQGTFSMSAHI